MTTMALRFAATRSAVALTRVSSSRCPSGSFSSFSSESSPGIFDRITQSFKDRSEKKRADEFAKQIQKMATSEKWTLQDFASEIDESLSSWRNKIPGMSNLEQVKMGKEAQRVIKAVVTHVGGEATLEDLQNLSRTDKLKISLQSGASVQDLNLLIQRFQGVHIMHQVLRKRQKEGRSLPTDEAGMKAAVQADARNVMTKAQKKQMQEQQMKRMGRSRRR